MGLEASEVNESPSVRVLSAKELKGWDILKGSGCMADNNEGRRSMAM